MSRPLTDFTGDALYLDTMIPYALLRGIDPAVQSLFARIEAGEPVAYTSVLTFDELTYRMLLALIQDHYGRSPLEHLRREEAKRLSFSITSVLGTHSTWPPCKSALFRPGKPRPRL